MEYYKYLELPEYGTSMDDIRNAYKRLALRYHPDRGSTGDADKFMKVHEAYQFLSSNFHTQIDPLEQIWERWLGGMCTAFREMLLVIPRRRVVTVPVTFEEIYNGGTKVVCECIEIALCIPMRKYILVKTSDEIVFIELKIEQIPPHVTIADNRYDVILRGEQDAMVDYMGDSIRIRPRVIQDMGLPYEDVDGSISYGTLELFPL